MLTYAGGFPVDSRSCRFAARSASLLAACILGALPAAIFAADENDQKFQFPATGAAAKGQAVLLAIDDMSLPLKRNLGHYLTKPTVRKEPVLKPSRDNPKAPDHLAAHFYGTVLQDGDRFRMWYYPVSYGKDFQEIIQGPPCYAESKDGLAWTKPNLGQVDYKGTTHNNAIKLPESKIEGVNVIKDDEDPDPQRRYKMIYNPWVGPTFSMQTATSPDGIHWTPRDGYPRQNDFFEQSGFLKFGGLFLVHGQANGPGEGGGRRGRQGYAAISTDFNHWLPTTAEAFALPEPALASERGKKKPYDQVHLGVASASLGNVAVGLYGLWHNAPGDASQNVPQSWFGREKTACDLGLVVSNDGIHFREPVKGHIYLSRADSPVTAADGKSLPTILIQSSGILNVGAETRIYHGRWRNGVFGPDYWGEVALATIPRDRWGALGLAPKTMDGEVWSAVVQLPHSGFDVVLNADAASGMRVEFADESFKPISGFSGEESGASELPGGLDCLVKWKAGSLASLGGKKVRLLVRMKAEGSETPRLYAVYLRSKEGRR